MLSHTRRRQLRIPAPAVMMSTLVIVALCLCLPARVSAGRSDPAKDGRFQLQRLQRAALDQSSGAAGPAAPDDVAGGDVIIPRSSSGSTSSDSSGSRRQLLTTTKPSRRHVNKKVPTNAKKAPTSRHRLVSRVQKLQADAAAAFVTATRAPTPAPTQPAERPTQKYYFASYWCVCCDRLTQNHIQLHTVHLGCLAPHQINH